MKARKAVSYATKGIKAEAKEAVTTDKRNLLLLGAVAAVSFFLGAIFF
jgi:hypothetical protein